MPTLVSTDLVQEFALYTADEFLDWLEPGIRCELIDGERYMHSPVSLKHGLLTNFVDRLLARFVEHHRLGVVHREVIALRLSSRRVLMPDIAFFRHEQIPRFQENYIPVAPAFVCEVLSPSTGHLDIGPKFTTYEEQGVEEYWILDPVNLRHRFYAKEGEILVEYPAVNGVVHGKALPGFNLPSAWLDPEHLPSVEAAFQALQASQGHSKELAR